MDRFLGFRDTAGRFNRGGETHLREGVERLPNEAAFHYNLACYECQMGDLEAAKVRLKRAFELDLSLRITALDDEDLQPLWTSLREPYALLLL